MLTYDVVIIGAGGAGMMCAMHAGARGRRVALIDHTTKIGRKILISGGGRCNFTNINTQPGAFVSKNPHFCKSALARYTPEDFIKMVRAHRISYHEKKLGQLFCDGSAGEIVRMLVSECEKAKAEFFLDMRVGRIEKDDSGRFRVQTTAGAFCCESLVIATGGLSIPQVGATGFGYDVARQFGLSIVPTAPALDGFNFTANDLKRFAEITGVSVDSIVTCNKVSFRENILFTHTGLSGPASLQASLYWNPGDYITINLLPELDPRRFLEEKKERGAKAEIKKLLAEILPKRFAERFCEMNQIRGNLSELSEKRMSQLSDALSAWEIYPSGTVGYKKAEVTRGGVDTAELSSKTMETRKVPGLYFVGEVVDVTGWLGGYNFQWAWASGFSAGQVV
ncbi:MAG TPA: NAD(P)/FAD-dependent oxidoreductase [Candidatus Obscuribacterales bacterium]